MPKQWYSTRLAIIGFHLLGWLLLFALPLIFPNNHRQPVDWKGALFNPVNIWFTLFTIAVFYLNAFYFIPFFLNRKKKWRYFLWLFLAFIVFYVVSNLIFGAGREHRPFSFHRESFFLIVPFLVIWSSSTLYRLSSDKSKTNQLLKEKENENLKTELLFLRSQVSPHFLFNVLNNMVAMARLGSKQLEPSLIKLSGLMRYMLYESDEDKVLLSRELEYVGSYIDLQRIRFGKDFPIRVDIPDLQDAYYLIEPMLLIPFIENAFKHGSGLIQEPEIDISLRVDRGIIDFCVKNKYDPESAESKDKTSGIGLSNVMRRLNLLYDQRHSLEMEQKDGWYMIMLQLKLQ